ncbi:MAG: hypothetical protein Q8L89_04295 [Gammaproteobacteria bacterium]|nr:hypothetical protein [Gammaproteobacteria bacterium]
MSEEKKPLMWTTQQELKQQQTRLKNLEEARDRISAQMGRAQGIEWFRLCSEWSGLNATIYTVKTVIANVKATRDTHGHEIGGMSAGSEVSTKHSNQQ